MTEPKTKDYKSCEHCSCEWPRTDEIIYCACGKPDMFAPGWKVYHSPEECIYAPDPPVRS